LIAVAQAAGGNTSANATYFYTPKSARVPWPGFHGKGDLVVNVFDFWNY